MTAVEMRVDPVHATSSRCSAGRPSLCGPASPTKTSSPRTSRTASTAGPPSRSSPSLPQFDYVGGFGAPWKATDDVPGDHDGTRRRGPAPTSATARATASTTSPAVTPSSAPIITMPAGGIAPRLTFEHYVATEAGFDGGNVKISVNGGDFELDPGRGLHLQRAEDADDAAGQQHQPARRRARLHRHRRRQGHRQLGRRRRSTWLGARRRRPATLSSCGSTSVATAVAASRTLGVAASTTSRSSTAS